MILFRGLRVLRLGCNAPELLYVIPRMQDHPTRSRRVAAVHEPLLLVRPDHVLVMQQWIFASHRKAAMKGHPTTLVLAAALMALSGCAPGNRAPAGSAHPSRTTQAAPDIAPQPPPPAHAELVPAPPKGVPEVWQPGHWRYVGRPADAWDWDNGRYVLPPPGKTTWVSGHWTAQPGGHWKWITGYWA